MDEQRLIDLHIFGSSIGRRHLRYLLHGTDHHITVEASNSKGCPDYDSWCKAGWKNVAEWWL